MSELASNTANASMAVAPSELRNLDVDITEAYERGKHDINFFASLLLPTVMLSPFPDFYVAIFRMLVNRTPKQMGKILRFALGLPRGHAKTTFIKVIIAWLIAYDKIQFAVILCATDGLAEELLEDVSEMLGSANAEAIYGRWTDQLSTDAKGIKKALYHDINIILVARGAGGAIRGVNIKHRRPDLIFCDDAQTKECDESQTESAKFRKRLVATFKIISPRGDRLIIYVGNMYSDTCILFQLKNNKSWISLVTGAILANGEPLWPELHSLDELLDSYLHDLEIGEVDVWFAEVMNDPVSRAYSLLNGQVPDAPFLFQAEVPDGAFITIDPAGFRKASDDNVICLHYLYDGKPTLRKVEAGNKNPEQLIIESLRMALAHGVSLIAIEDTAYQQTLLFWINKYITAWNITGINVVPLKPKNRSKESRLRIFCEEVIAGNYYIHPDCLAQWLWQAMKYKLGKDDNKDDVLDAAAYGLDVRTEYWHLVVNLNIAGMLSASNIIPVEDNTPF
jgi:hypothetical protein